MRSSASAPEKRAMGSNSASSSTFAFPKRRICGCGGNVVLIKSKTTNNPGRMFWRCPYWTCSYFKWADEDGFDEQLGLAAVDGAEIVGDKKLKVLKLKKKLDAEKRKAKMFMGVAVGSWVLTLIVCVVCVGKCPCTLF
ncbi:Zinc finger, GRF-type [Sesbania bispinosa]|nr:Zinc finger, GRF-type [Sesbania bispinosa]KAJ1427943.1 Zinc finger, GRF-type [Sesbania bispinosa]